MVVLSYNNSADTAASLRSLLSQRYSHQSVMLLDNGSTDGSVAELRAQFPGLTIRSVSPNRGFAGGANAGIQASLQDRPDYVLLVSNDTVADEEMVAELVSAGERYPEVGLVAPAIYYHDAPHRLWSAGARSRQVVPFPRDLRAKDLRGDVELVDFVTGCAVLLRPQLVERVGLFDERYRQYYEDNDLCQRVRAAGIGIACATRARLLHKVGLTLRRKPARLRYLQTVGRIRYYGEHVHGWQRALVAVWLVWQVVRSTLVALRRGEWSSVAALAEGLRDGLGELRRRRPNGVDVHQFRQRDQSQ
ncbi:MAG: glycosyltransferase family 2 protein [Chloroflexi bacterium]|nr:glycosyltransferase family 2 protein [Chloroflexota bacterium]